MSSQHAPLRAGKEIYVDVQGWHLYLKDIHVDTDITMDQVRWTMSLSGPGYGPIKGCPANV